MHGAYSNPKVSAVWINKIPLLLKPGKLTCSDDMEKKPNNSDASKKESSVHPELRPNPNCIVWVYISVEKYSCLIYANNTI